METRGFLGILVLRISKGHMLTWGAPQKRPAPVTRLPSMYACAWRRPLARGATEGISTA